MHKATLYTSLQDGPSLESSSYVNMTLEYLGPWDLGTPGPGDPPQTPPHTSSYILLPPPFSSSYSPPLVWFGMVLVWFGMRGGVLSCDI